MGLDGWADKHRNELPDGVSWRVVTLAEAGEIGGALVLVPETLPLKALRRRGAAGFVVVDQDERVVGTACEDDLFGALWRHSRVSFCF